MNKEYKKRDDQGYWGLTTADNQRIDSLDVASLHLTKRNHAESVAAALKIALCERRPETPPCPGQQRHG
jgi:hypothetical protein